MPKYIEIDTKILWRVHKGIATPDEQQLFAKWSGANSKNRKYFNLFCERFEADRSQLTDEEIERCWKQVYFSISVKRRLSTVFKYAAAIAIPLLVGLSIVYLTDTSQPKSAETEKILPGVKKATLFLSDGSTLALDDVQDSFVFEENGQVVGKDSLNTLTYSNAPTNNIIYNTIMVPIGGEYNLVLSDGTKVWLNADSELKYPVSFMGDKRDVFLRGEAFFNVAHNKTKPFFVHSDNSSVKVYGTEFNFMTYKDDNVEQITLVSGKVGVNINGKQTFLEPGQQAEVLLSASSVSVKEVNTELYTAWTGGELVFENMALNELAKKLSRWYEVDFFFANQNVTQKRFTGVISKDSDFEFFMSLIEKTTNVKITVNNRTVLVQEQN
ncbi:DUF4974 domain-containing protein [Carboxylicivirga sp. A043]|uniref:FecR family protein n=1 Tax=Carboxylicivirga litoralis TaxID=2816963 RepID=UPI0021CAEBEC|nr:FecR family protein [Carboxylicivirga sp. A043]MCU4156727.1 DUF4974 domain-containing protein [Carboxylicivirga sp. A043]